MYPHFGARFIPEGAGFLAVEAPHPRERRNSRPTGNGSPARRGAWVS
jgi:hypothetical protein